MSPSSNNIKAIVANYKISDRTICYFVNLMVYAIFANIVLFEESTSLSAFGVGLACIIFTLLVEMWLVKADDYSSYLNEIAGYWSIMLLVSHKLPVLFLFVLGAFLSDYKELAIVYTVSITVIYTVVGIISDCNNNEIDFPKLGKYFGLAALLSHGLFGCFLIFISLLV